MKKLVIGEVDLLEKQSKSVLIILSNRMVKSHSLMNKLTENMIDTPIESDVFLNNVKVMMENNTFSERYNESLVGTTFNMEDELDMEFNEFEY